MKRLLVAGFLLASLTTQAQVINFAKTLPVSSFSFGVAPAYNADNVFYTPTDPMSYLIYAGYGIGYDIDINVKYGLYQGTDFIGVDMQYLFKEARRSYFSIFGGIHKWTEWGVDMTGAFTYSPEYWLNLSTGLDMDVDLADELLVRAWIPLNIGFNVTERMFVFLEYDLPATEKSWDIFAGGVNFIIR